MDFELGFGECYILGGAWLWCLLVKAGTLGGGFGEQEQGFGVPQQAGGALPCPLPHC